MKIQLTAIPIVLKEMPQKENQKWKSYLCKIEYDSQERTGFANEKKKNWLLERVEGDFIHIEEDNTGDYKNFILLGKVEIELSNFKIRLEIHENRIKALEDDVSKPVDAPNHVTEDDLPF